MTEDKSRIIRDAATVVLIRDAETEPRVLMGQRGAKAAFMPNKFVFPGGALDGADWHVPLAEAGAEPCRTRLGEEASPGIGPALLAAAIRELWEETGQILGEPGDWRDAPEDWADFAATGHVPSPDGLAFVFRAITPPGRTRRFDARFFLADAKRLKTDPDDFSRACDELSALQWIPLAQVRDFDLPFVTQVVLAEVAARLPDVDAPESVPFFKNDEEQSRFLRLGGVHPMDAVMGD
ncbi:NUDIX domain-containing protein [Maritimibacter sp. DP1N21-5]|uniref:NUDIX hydrolase n=1 Tax=Maritimibacter sp. DP1N21-5 TaxID=2836867 RepID=UPI001C43F975|nr:NUDIX domain-containing protein [Maritimibacter sp. DP1N21-5]MBV7409234.1 NUDIX domain-containing protein [Maritimibacter sp. DP1N21-5]